MRTRARPTYGSGAPGWGDKSSPPEFLSRKQAPAERAGWFKGLAPRGKVVVLFTAVCLAAVIAALCVSLTTGTSRSNARPGHPTTPGKTTQVPRLSFTLGKKVGGVELSLLTFSLSRTIKAATKTSKALDKALTGTFGAGDPATLSARLEILADGSDGAEPTTPSGPTSGPGSDIADRYVKLYSGYLARVTAVRKQAEGLSLLPADQAKRAELLVLCDQISRDLSVVIDGLNRLRAPGDEDTGSIARGIQAANARLSIESQRLDRLTG